MIVNVFVGHDKLFQRNERLAVQLLYFVVQSGGVKSGMQNSVFGKNAGANVTSQRFDKNAVAVVIVQHKDVGVAAVLGGDNKYASLVGVGLQTAAKQ